MGLLGYIESSSSEKRVGVSRRSFTRFQNGFAACNEAFIERRRDPMS